jgi:hypothetical protein
MEGEKMKRIDKPWGYELVLGEYLGWRIKILHVNDGHRNSKQYHTEKNEIMFFNDGTMERIPAKMIHRLEGEVDVLEISRGSDDDIVRLEDDYGRITETLKTIV